MFVLSGDIGGTTSRFAVYDEQYNVAEYEEIKTKNITNFQDTLRNIFDNVSKKGYIIEKISLGVAGPVNKEKITLTNTDLTIDMQRIRMLPVKEIYVLNDVEAYGYGVTTIKDVTHITGPKNTKGTKAVLTVGTGVGKAIITNQNPPLVLPSEGGHIEPPYTFMNIIKKQQEILGTAQVTIEDILGGKNITHINKAMTGNTTSIKKIFRNEEYKETKEVLENILISTARNYALTSMCTGGLYLGGGVIQKHHDLLKKLKKEFTTHKTHSEFLENIPVYRVDNPKTGLQGAATYALLQ